MKVGVIGAGAVGSACVLSMLQRGSCREIVLVNRTRERAAETATDMRYGRPLSPPVDVTDGDYEDLAGAELVMITSGVNEQSGGRDRSRRPSRPSSASGRQRRHLPRDRPADRGRRAGGRAAGGHRPAGPPD